jgi:hypothetical protein
MKMIEESIDSIKEDFHKYKWFYTKSGKLVIGGKSAIQNDQLLRRIKEIPLDLIVMHTQEPGSPFSVILEDPKKVKSEDLEQRAIFTGCFSRAWRSKKKRTSVHIFKSSFLSKTKAMKSGTWRVLGKVKKKSVLLELALTIQDEVLRAVPESAIKNKKDKILTICPGTIDKKTFITKIHLETDRSFSQEEVLSALPAGGVKICR